MRIRRTSLLLLLIFSLSMSACQKIELARTELTQSQWRQVEPYLLEAPPSPKFPIDTVFADEIKLIGLDIDGDLIPGEEVTFTWYWQALAEISQDWKIFVHLDSKEPRFRQNLDHYPLQTLMNEVYRTYHWQQGQIIKDVQTFRLASDTPPGEIRPFVGLYRGDLRAPITSEEAANDRRAPGPLLTIAGEAAVAPDYHVPFLEHEVAQTLLIDGRLDEDFWEQLPALTLHPISGNGRYSTEIRAGFTSEALIIGAKMEDEHIWATLTERDKDLWSEEVLELFFAPRGADNPYFELQINPLGTIFDARFEKPLSGGASARRAAINKGLKYTILGLKSAHFIDGTLNDETTQDRSWSVELKIPFAALGLDDMPTEQDSWLVNIYRIDRPSKDETHAYAWSTLANKNFHNIAKFGTWSFAASGVNSIAERRLRRARRILRKESPSPEGRPSPQPERFRGRLDQLVKPPSQN